MTPLLAWLGACVLGVVLCYALAGVERYAQRRRRIRRRLDRIGGSR